MDPRMTMVRISVEDVERSCQFYEGLGWQRHKLSFANIAVFQLGPMVFGLVRKDILEKELNLTASSFGGAGRVTMDHHVDSKEEVEAVLKEAEALGAKIICRDVDGPLGANNFGCFEDLDGHIWRIVCSTLVALDPDGSVSLPD